MLPADEPVRVFHNAMKEEMELYDMVVVGVVNETHPQGVFNVEALRNIHALTEFAKTLRWQDPEHPEEKIGVMEVDLLAPSTVDDIDQAGLGTVRFDWLMREPPSSEKEALDVRRRAQRIPLMNGTLVSEDGKALALYLPLTSKDLSFRVYDALRDKIAELDAEEEYFITGLPVAEDAFGVEMFIQMGISAPLAMLVIFLLMLYFFRKLILITAPMIVAMVSVICTMALLVITGNTVHIMSSMIPIFIMPIAVLDSVHILSEFFETYQKCGGDRRQALTRVMEKLFVHMLYTSLTTLVAFASLALVPIPPLQVFGLFVALGVALAWILSITFIPAFIMSIPQRKLAGFGIAHPDDGQPAESFMSQFLLRIGKGTTRHSRKILAGALIGGAIGLYGISCIVINDNPVRWFSEEHPIRVADRVLNQHFGGSYMAYLALEPGGRMDTLSGYAYDTRRRLQTEAKRLAIEYPLAPAVFKEVGQETRRLQNQVETPKALLDGLVRFVNTRLDGASDDRMFDAWEQASLFIAAEQQRGEVFKQPEVLTYIEGLQQYLLETAIVGKSVSLADFVKTVHRELLLGEDTAYRIPDSANSVAQTLMTYQNSHRPQDLWRFVTPDFRKANIWLQLKSGDNRD
ncbi:MAG: MMPL family transporter, partial [Halobacteria archaeon]|nr:MMPL family transporter [Halobacteria archaeon]